MPALRCFRRVKAAALLVAVMPAVLTLPVRAIDTDYAHPEVRLVSIGTEPKRFGIEDVTFIDERQGWVLASTRRRAIVLSTTDGGETWKTEGAPRLGVSPHPTQREVSRIRFLDERRGWAYGPGVFATSDGGSSWKRVLLRGSVSDVEPGADSVWALVTRCPAHRACVLSLFSIHADRSARRVLTFPALHPPGSLDYVEAELVRHGEELAWVGFKPPEWYENGHVVLRTTDGGRTWAWIPSPCSPNRRTGESGQSMDLSISPEGVLWGFCGDEPSAGQEHKYVRRSFDYGDHWTKPLEIASGGYLGRSTAVSPGLAWMNGSRCFLIRFANGGRRWRWIAPDCGYDANGSAFLDATHGWIGMQRDLFFTNDGGRTWRVVDLAAVASRIKHARGVPLDPSSWCELLQVRASGKSSCLAGGRATGIPRPVGISARG